MTRPTRRFDNRRLALTVDVTPSVDIREACEDAIGLAETMGVMIRFDFNGKNILVIRGMNIERCVEQYNASAGRDYLTEEEFELLKRAEAILYRQSCMSDYDAEFDARWNASTVFANAHKSVRRALEVEQTWRDRPVQMDADE